VGGGGGGRGGGGGVGGGGGGCFFFPPGERKRSLSRVGWWCVIFCFLGLPRKGQREEGNGEARGCRHERVPTRVVKAAIVPHRPLP